MKISIALATYNGEKYLQEQLDSYIDQERLPNELVICDDASTDNTIIILKKFKETAPFEVNIYENESNLGYAQNFGKALSLCTGDIIFFSDQDDVWLPNKLKVVEKVFTNNQDISVVIHDGELVNAKLEKTGVTKLSQIRAGGYRDESFVTGTLSAVHKNLLPLVLPFPKNITIGHDGWVHTVAKIMGKRIILDESLQKIRRHDNNTSQWVVNSLSKIKKFDVFKSQLSTKVANSYEDRIGHNKSLINLFKKVNNREKIIDFTVDTKSIISVLNDEYLALIRRQKLISKGFFGKKIQALTMLIHNDYKYFNGFKSFVRDIFR